MKIAVIGATGTIGSKIAAELEKRGHEVVPISRSHGVDVSSLADLSAALTGVDVVIDAINNMIMSSKKAQTAFISTSSNIAQAAADNDVKRIVCVSIAGVENPAVSRGYGYYAGKAAQEKTYQDSAVDTVIIRSTQWFELLDPIVQQVTVGPVSVLPTMKMAPIPADAAAQLVCDVADGSEKVPGTGIVSIRGEEEGTSINFSTNKAKITTGGNMFDEKLNKPKEKWENFDIKKKYLLDEMSKGTLDEILDYIY